ncbi:hypothetical protein [Arthrobacter sp. NicSoilB8]|uniref:hypothetical protein n=1 Tax=Arthrobacter sp. NicSoilB8 TaxID=2830998 RepID=UPI001CC3E804|nr:hypothetical protein [Arthrobacter sp. NicSoilB8]BCW71582.1 hypothetical protein NicSoilB8_26260 [Arthrobacter sp. NicSoilB8]
MSVEPSSTPGRPQEQEPVDLASGAEHAADAAGIRHQAARIIEAVLADTAPEHDKARELLRRQIAAHPGHPERALAEHLAALKAVAGPFEGTSGAALQIWPDVASGE